MRALIGDSGFIGGNLKIQQHFDYHFNSKNIQSIRDKSYKQVYCAAAPGTKWLANSNPKADKDKITDLMSHLSTVNIEKLILISTVDVYGDVTGAKNEEDPCKLNAQTPYGRHRWELENFCRENFDTIILRLPLLFGSGLKKNVLYDLLNEENLELVNPCHQLQWYDLKLLTYHINHCLEKGISLINLTSVPILMETVISRFFPYVDVKSVPQKAQHYNIQSKYANEMGVRGNYILGEDQIFSRIEEFIFGYGMRNISSLPSTFRKFPGKESLSPVV